MKAARIGRRSRMVLIQRASGKGPDGKIFSFDSGFT